MAQEDRRLFQHHHHHHPHPPKKNILLVGHYHGSSFLKLMELIDIFLLQVNIIMLNKWSPFLFQREFVPFPTWVFPECLSPFFSEFDLPTLKMVYCACRFSLPRMLSSHSSSYLQSDSPIFINSHGWSLGHKFSLTLCH